MVPAYIRIHDEIKKEIDRGVWEIGQRLPSVIWRMITR